MTAPVVRRDGQPGPPPRCDSCHQTLPWNPPLCACGHTVGSHHPTKGGNITYCCHGDQNGVCDCGQYAQATDGHYGPLEAAS